MQEWLSLHGYRLAIDGEFGPATEAAITSFQTAHSIDPSGHLCPTTIEALERPMALAEAPAKTGESTLGQIIVAYAQQHLALSPREVGGPNRGPWVRLYCGGRDGSAYRWCAGFVHFVVAQASEHIGAPMPTLQAVPHYLSCDAVARHARDNRRLHSGEPQIGEVFLRKKSSNDWDHAGIVVGVQPGAIITIEGNTNAGGSRDGDGVYRRFRRLANMDFIRVGD